MNEELRLKMVVKTSQSSFSDASLCSTNSRGSKSTLRVYSRLYDKSSKRQQEGKELRQQIEDKRTPTHSAALQKKTTKKQAEDLSQRLYQRARIMKLEAERVAAATAADEKQRSREAFRTIDKTSAKKLYDRLSSAETQKRTGPPKPSSEGTNTVTMVEKDARLLFERLHFEKMGKGKKN